MRMAKFKFIDEQELFNSPIVQLWRNFTANHVALLGFWCFISLLLIAILAPLLAPYSPFAHHADALLLPPSWQDNGQVRYLLGTDDLGRDILSRLIVGSSLTFGLSIICALLIMVLGVALGAVAGMSKGFRSSMLNHVLDITLAIPSLLLAIIIVAILGPGLMNTFWAIVLAMLPQFIHSVRNLVHQQLQKDYIIAYRLDGANPWQLFRTGIFPNIFEDIVILFTMVLSNTMLDIAALGFLQLGAQPPTPEWGAILSDNLDLLYVSPWAVALPGVLLFMAVFSTNLVGDGLREALKKRREQ